MCDMISSTLPWWARMSASRSFGGEVGGKYESITIVHIQRERKSSNSEDTHIHTHTHSQCVS